MNRRVLVLEVLAAMLLAGCGSSGHPSSRTSGGAGASATTGAAAGSTATTGASATSTPHAGATGASPGTVTSPPRAATAPEERIQLRARFSIGAGGALTPPTVSAPGSLPIDLSVASGDGRAHRVEVRTPTPHTLSVGAGATASTLITGLHNGNYAILVDGVKRGALVIGVQPGP